MSPAIRVDEEVYKYLKQIAKERDLVFSTPNDVLRVIFQLDQRHQSFEQAREFARNLGLNSLKEWRRFTESDPVPAGIPMNPNIAYKLSGWAGWSDFLGTRNIRQYRPFGEAREFVRSLNLKNMAEWRNHCKSGVLPDDIPSYPERPYRDGGWIDYRDWLNGDGTIG